MLGEGTEEMYASVAGDEARAGGAGGALATTVVGGGLSGTVFSKESVEFTEIRVLPASKDVGTRSSASVKGAAHGS